MTGGGKQPASRLAAGAGRLLDERARLLRRLAQIEDDLDAMGVIVADRTRIRSDPRAAARSGAAEADPAEDLFDNLPL